MIKPIAAILPCGKRLHLQHGPIDLVIGVNRDHQTAFHAAKNRFETILEELADELPALRSKTQSKTRLPNGFIAKNMHKATLPYCHGHFITPMAAVAGAVADTILNVMKEHASFEKAYVNNGGDISLYLKKNQTFVTAISSHNGMNLGRIEISAEDKIGGIATSGRHGRSFSLGIADSVTVLAKTAAKADVAATLIANAVNIENHPLIKREPANSLDPDSDLGHLPVVTKCQYLCPEDQAKAIEQGALKANQFFAAKLIYGAAIFFQNETRIIGSHHLKTHERVLDYA